MSLFAEPSRVENRERAVNAWERGRKVTCWARTLRSGACSRPASVRLARVEVYPDGESEVSVTFRCAWHHRSPAK